MRISIKAIHNIMRASNVLLGPLEGRNLPR